MAMTLNDRVRQRLKAEKTARHLSERDLAGQLSWSQSRLSQKLNGRTPITLNELEALCFVLGLAPSEAVRDQGYEFCAEMTPGELRLFQRLRREPKVVMDAILTLFRATEPTPEERRKPKPIIQPGRR